jgi:hypothetical protein
MFFSFLNYWTLYYLCHWKIIHKMLIPFVVLYVGIYLFFIFSRAYLVIGIRAIKLAR